MPSFATLGNMKDLTGLFDYQRQQAQGPITSLGAEQNALLEELRKYDPNARWDFQDNSGSSNEGGQVAPNTYLLNFDATKLPNAGGTRKNEPMPAFNSAGQAQGIQQLGGENHPRLFNENVRWNSPDYGEITDSRNVNDRSGTDMLYTLAPAVIMAIATMGAGAPLLGGLGGAATASGATSLEAMLTQLMPGLLQAGGNGTLNLTNGLQRVIPSIAQQFGVPSWMTQLGSLAASGLNRGGGG